MNSRLFLQEIDGSLDDALCIHAVHGTNKEIFHHYGMDAEGIVKAAIDFLKK